MSDKVAQRLVTLGECIRETGVSKKTLYRWIESGQLKRRFRKVRIADVQRLKCVQKIGRPLGKTIAEKAYLATDAPALAVPYLNDAGLDLFAEVARLVISHHSRIRPKAVSRALTAMLLDS